MSDLTLGEALATAQARIDPVDARVLLCYAAGRDSSYVIAHPEVPLRPQEQQNFLALVDRRSKGEPVAYLTGEREFYGRLFRITPVVLIPRPETELLVDFVLERVPHEGLMRILELGTGSGCVAISIASERPNAKLLALDRSLDALALARKNAVQTNVGNVAFLRSDWFSALRSEHFDMIVANPPYVASTDPHLSQGDLRFEPRAALDGGPDGLEAIRHIVTEGKTHLKPGGWLLFEHGHDQGERSRLLLHAAGFVEIFTAHDTAGIERVSAGKLTNELQLA